MYLKHGFILHAEKWFKMGPGKPKSSSACEHSAFVRHTEAAPSQLPFVAKSLRLRAFLLMQHSRDKGAAVFPFLPDNVYEAEKRTNVWSGFAFRLVG